MTVPAWREFNIAGRTYSWKELRHATHRSIEVRSDSFVIRIFVTGEPPAHLYLGPVAVIGTEFPPGVVAIDPPYLMRFRSDDSDRHGQIDTELVKSVVQRYANNKTYRRQAMGPVHREALNLPVHQLPESTEERLEREARERKRADELAVVAAKDALITRRRCPFCGQPCPSYRVTCKHCGQRVR